MHRNIMKSDEMKHEMVLIYTIMTNINVLFKRHLLFVTTYGLVWSSLGKHLK